VAGPARDPRSLEQASCARTTTNPRIMHALRSAWAVECAAPRAEPFSGDSSDASSTIKVDSGSADAHGCNRSRNHHRGDLEDLRVVRERLGRAPDKTTRCFRRKPKQSAVLNFISPTQPPGRPRLPATTHLPLHYLDYDWALTAREKPEWVNAQQQLQILEVRLPSGEQTEPASARSKGSATAAGEGP